MALAAALGVGCARGAPTGDGARDAVPPTALAPRTRAEAVSLADRLAVEASRASGTKSAERYAEAAELRERFYRLEHREADAFEAAELFGAAARAAPERRCELAARQVALEAERRSDPADAYRRLYAERRRATDGRCRSKLESALLALAAYRPTPRELAALDADTDGVPVPPASGSGAPIATVGRVVVPDVPDGGTDPARILRVERYGAKDAARVVVHLSRPARFEVSSLAAAGGAPPRIVIDLPGVTRQGKSSLLVGGLVERVRLGSDPERARVVLDLSGPAYSRAFYLPEPFRLVVDVSKDAGSGPAGQGARSVRRVVLDPGHGGHDPGAAGPQGLLEKDVTLDVAHRAAPLLARELGVSTLLTRDADVFVALDERTARANAFGADLLISIHCNASEDGGGKGVMSFVLDDARDGAAARVAARENAASAAAANELASALSGFLDRNTVARSEHFAALLQRASMASLGVRYPDVPDLGVRRAGFYVLAGAAMPAVLFEASFISNPLGEARLNTPDYREKLADAIVNAVRAYQAGK